jgi:hypothetical protein
MKLIGITGAAGSGKDTAADRLVSAHAFRKVSFAGPLKDGLCAMFNWTPEQINDRVFKETSLPDIGKSPRQLMQLLGTEYGREMVHPDIWLILARRKIEAFMQYRSVVISDVRFDNEAEMIRAMGGQIIHLIRPGISAVAAHVSEQGVTINHTVDIGYQNDRSIGELHAWLDWWAVQP